MIIVANVVTVGAELASALPLAPLRAGGLADLVQLGCTAGMAALAIREHTSTRPPRHRWTVLFSVLAGAAALYGWSVSAQRLVDTVAAAALLVTATMNAIPRRRP